MLARPGVRHEFARCLAARTSRYPITRPSFLSVHDFLQPPSLGGVVEPQLVNAGGGPGAGLQVCSDPEKGLLSLAVPPWAHLLPACLDALDGVAAAAPGKGRRLLPARAQRHADRLIDPARHR